MSIPGTLEWTTSMLGQMITESCDHIWGQISENERVCPLCQTRQIWTPNPDAPPTGRHAAMPEKTVNGPVGWTRIPKDDESGMIAPPERTLMGDLGQLDKLTHQLADELDKLTQRLGPVLNPADRMPLASEDIPELSPAQLAVSDITDRVRSLTDQIEWLTRSVRA